MDDEEEGEEGRGGLSVMVSVAAVDAALRALEVIAASPEVWSVDCEVSWGDYRMLIMILLPYRHPPFN